MVLNLSDNPSYFLTPDCFVIWDELGHTRGQLRLVDLRLEHLFWGLRVNRGRYVDKEASISAERQAYRSGGCFKGVGVGREGVWWVMIDVHVNGGRKGID